MSLMTLQDVASLARVQRPVVTMWRKRSRGTSTPFPVGRTVGGQEFFDLDDVVGWLEDTERGNNPDVRADAAAHALWDSSPEARGAATRALSALLTLRHLTGSALTSLTPDALIDLADEHDPDDECLYTEIARASDLQGLARVADDLVEACWGVQGAHQRVLDQRFRSSWAPLASAALSDEARRLLVTASSALMRDLGEGARLMDPTGRGVDTLVAAATEASTSVLLVRGETPLARLVRRQLLLADVGVRSLDRGDGDWSVTGPVVHLVVLPTGDEPDASAADLLALVDEVRLQMDEHQVALVLGPASVFADPLTGSALTRRDELLRDGWVRAIIRLPAGLRVSRAREHQALWLVAAPEATSAFERRTGVADLSSVPLGGRVIAGIVDDLLAMRQGTEGARRRAWAHLSHVATSELVSRSGSLVTLRRRHGGVDDRSPADFIVGLRRADEEFGVLAGLDLAPAHGGMVVTTLGQAVIDGWARIISGQKVEVGDLPDGNVPVVGASGLEPGRPVDRFALLTRVDARLTDPGDILVTTGRTPSARLDLTGGTLVLAPARVLRLKPTAPVSAAAVVARINAATPGSDWHTWPLAVLPTAQAHELARALERVRVERDALVARLARLDALASNLTAAVESRRVSIDREDTHGTRTED